MPCKGKESGKHMTCLMEVNLIATVHATEDHHRAAAEWSPCTQHSMNRLCQLSVWFPRSLEFLINLEEIAVSNYGYNALLHGHFLADFCC